MTHDSIYATLHTGSRSRRALERRRHTVPTLLLRGSFAARYAEDHVKRAGSTTAVTAEQPLLNDEQRVERLALLAQRLRDPDGLDRDALEHIEQLPGDE